MEFASFPNALLDVLGNSCAPLASESLATERDPQVVSARRALLDALDALGPHRDAVILVGAQAIYFHTGEADLVQLAEPYLSGWRHKIITDPDNWADGSIGALRV